MCPPAFHKTCAKHALRVVVAPDSFKGTLTAAEAAEAIAEGLADVLPAGSRMILPEVSISLRQVAFSEVKVNQC